MIKEILSLRSSIYRRWIWHFKCRYVLEQLRTRKGSCEGCGGVCCSRTRRCRLLIDGKCSAFKDKIPFFCWVFPIDKKDIELAGMEDVCQFYWDK